MLSKPLSHIRPLLRLPSHPSTSPEHFTPNPSLLHHLPPNGIGNALVSQAQSSAQAAGSNAGGAGRAGYGSGSAGAGHGGYTGHARAFLSLPQTSGSDPTSSLTNDDNARSKSSTSARRSGLLLKHRLGRQTRLIGPPPEGVGRGVRREIEARSGSSRLGLVDIEDEDCRGRSELEGTSRRQGSIVYPSLSRRTVSPLPSPRAVSTRTTTSHSRPSTPPRTPRPKGLSQSKTSLEIWQVGIPQSRAQISARPLSTRSASTASKPLPEADEDDQRPVSPDPTTFEPPVSSSTRALMDLAGVDLPSLNRSAGTARRNSTAGIGEPQGMHEGVVENYEDLMAAEEPSLEETQGVGTKAIDSDKRLDTEIFTALWRARQARDRKSVHMLVQYYRSPRTAAPFNHLQSQGSKSLAARLPLPRGYTYQTYNVCLDALLAVRNPGESISSILEVYNEMLERDLVPNIVTYQHVIRALCQREGDVWSAMNQWKEEKKWAKFMNRAVSSAFDAENAAAKDLVMEGYKAEGNFESALKLFRAANLTKGQRKFAHGVYLDLILAVSKQPEPDLSVVMEVFRQGQRNGALGLRSLYGLLFQCFGSAKNADGLKQLWQEYEQDEKQGKVEDGSEWLNDRSEASALPIPQRIDALARSNYRAAITAFANVGEHDAAFMLIGKMMATPPINLEDTPDLTLPPRPTRDTVSELLEALVTAGHVDKALEWYPKAMEIIRELGSSVFHAAPVFRLSDGLVLAGKWKEAVGIVEGWIRDRPSTMKGSTAFDRVKLKHLYAAVLEEARLADNEDVAAILAYIPRFLDIPNPETGEPTGEQLLYLDTHLVPAHCDVLLRIGRYSELAQVFDRYEVVGKKLSWWLGPLTRRIAKAKILFTDLCALVRAMQRHGWAISNMAESFVASYLAARAKVDSPSKLNLHYTDFYRLVIAVTSLPVDKITEGEYDECLVTLLGDLATLNTERPGYMDWASSQRHNELAGLLVDRFGRDRATQMVEGAYGAGKAEKLLPPLVIETPSSDLSTVEGSSPVFSLPSTPESMSTAPESPVPSGTPLILDARLTERIIVGKDFGYVLNAYRAIKQGLERRRVPTPEALGRVIVELGRERDEAKVFELYMVAQHVLATAVPPQLQQREWAIVEDSMLMACCFLGHLEQAGMHRARIVQAGIAPTADAYATMIASSKDTTDDALVARELFDESRAMGVEPNLYLYNTIISKLSKARKAEMAIELFKHMKIAGVHPSSVTYGAVINACCRVGDAESAETLFAEMSSMPKFKPRVPPYNTMMQFHLTTQPSREKVLHYFGALRGANVPPSAHTYKLLLDAYAVLPPTDLTSMEKVFADLCADRSNPVQATHWASIIAGYGIYGNDVAKAIQVFESIPTHPSTRDQNVVKDPVVWEAILNVISNKGTLEELEGMRHRMVELGAGSTAYVNNVLIGAYARAGQIERARELFEHMGDSVTGVAAPNNHPSLRTSSGHVKPSTVTSEPTRVVYREPSTYEAMIRAELRAGSKEAAEAICARMEERRYPVAVFLRAKAILGEHMGGEVTSQQPIPARGYPTMPHHWQAPDPVFDMPTAASA